MDISHCISSSEWRLDRELEEAIKTFVSKVRRDESMKGWLTHVHKCVLPLNRRGVNEWSPRDRFLCFSEGSGEWGMGEVAGRTTQFFSTSSQLTFFLPNAVVPEGGLQLWCQSRDDS